MSEPLCRTCADVGRKGYCARGRCYCGHPTCHGFDSWIEAAAPKDTPVRTTPSESAWDAREGSTWIDKL